MKLKTNLKTGLIPTDFEKRISHFGTNRKDPPERTSYWVFFIKAIDDFMLKLLLVCAVVDIGFEVGFAEDSKERSTGKFTYLILAQDVAIYAQDSWVIHAARSGVLGGGISFLIDKYYNFQI